MCQPWGLFFVPANRGRKVGHARAASATHQPRAAPRGVLQPLPTATARRDGGRHHAAMDAAEASLRERWPELSAKEASAEVVAAIAYASSHHPTWLWDGVGG